MTGVTGAQYLLSQPYTLTASVSTPFGAYTGDLSFAASNPLRALGEAQASVQIMQGVAADVTYTATPINIPRAFSVGTVTPLVASFTLRL